jgi:hypothetical protein
MQLLGSLTQSITQRKRSHANQPIGGVRAKPFSNALDTLVTVKINISSDFILLFPMSMINYL